VLRLLEGMRRAADVRRNGQLQGGEMPRFFEIGFGCGELLAAVAQAGYEVAGIEVSSRMLEQARSRLSQEHRDRLFLGDLLSHELEGAARSYDLVYWNDVFEHLPVDESLDYLRRAHALLAPGGALLTVTPNWHARPSDVTADHLPPRSEPRGFHLKEYTLREMAGLLREAGFTRITTPLLVTRRRSVLWGDGLLRLKSLLEPALEGLPFGAADLLVRGLALSMTIAWKR
jgi:SAM-dependent methyltransferase